MRYSWQACAEMFLDVVDEALGMPGKRADQDRLAPGRPRLVLE
jgi:hypothetical protein